MGYDWSRVKEKTLWHYEELTEKLLHVLSYDFVKTKYDRKLRSTRKMVQDFFKNRDDDKYTTYSLRVSDTLRQIEIFGIRTIAGLVDTIHERDDCTNFVETCNVSFDELIGLLNCCLRWILPFARPIREFIEPENTVHVEYLSSLRKRGIKNNLDMIEECRSPIGRQKLEVLSNVPSDFILGLTHRADISRLPYVSGKTVKIFNKAGYDTLDEIANTTVDELVTRLEESLLLEGMKFSRSFIDPEGAFTQARVIPPLFEI